MARYVLKFGGTSVANVTRLHHVANLVKEQAEAGHELVVVVSAMAGITNELVGYAQSLCPDKLTPEHDVVLSSGEQVTSGLLALALTRLGLISRSYLAWQVPIVTDDNPSQARILKIETEQLERCLKQGIIPVVAGFQGINDQLRLTTLGRGGSDTTAVALAAALKADRCDIYTDVDGVYTADPRLVANARKLGQITYAEMFEMAAQGAKVLQARSVELALKHRVKLRVLSSFFKASGTDIVEERKFVESTQISGIAHNPHEVLITLKGVPHQIDLMAQIFNRLAQHRISVDMLVQTHAVNGKVDLNFTLPQADLERAQPLLEQLQKELIFSNLDIDQDVVKISVVGIGMRSNLEIGRNLFNTLASHQISVRLLTTSEIKMSVLITKQQTALALNVLHEVFNLEGGDKECALSA